ncbi:type II toxin-antitoxin system RelE/ParE family toxin [Roseovarius sp.]|uniref:type II toxin-antitoxin system RelE/ParE family toxin n=1 Tax=Roseovarius sp. TaxID=1486281 RepID=UPI003A986F92
MSRHCRREQENRRTRSPCTDPEGSTRSTKARTHLKAIQKTLAANPYAGHPSDARENVRERSIPRTPFTLICRVAPTQIEILRLWDTRQGTGY